MNKVALLPVEGARVFIADKVSVATILPRRCDIAMHLFDRRDYSVSNLACRSRLERTLVAVARFDFTLHHRDKTMAEKRFTIASSADINNFIEAIVASLPKPPSIPSLPSISSAIPQTRREQEEELRKIETFFAQNPRVHWFDREARNWANAFTATYPWTLSGPDSMSQQEVTRLAEYARGVAEQRGRDIDGRFASEISSFTSRLNRVNDRLTELKKLLKQPPPTAETSPPPPHPTEELPPASVPTQTTHEEKPSPTSPTMATPTTVISLQKGGNVSLSKKSPGLNKIKVGLGWDVRTTDGTDFDLDASAFLLSESGKVRSSADFIFYNQLESADGSVVHTGDNRTGEGEGDDEEILVTLNSVAADVQKIAVVVSIHDADEHGQNFGQVSSAFIRIVNMDNNAELARFDLSEDASTHTAMIFGELYRHGGDWKFRAVGQGFSGGLGVLARNYGINVGGETQQLSPPPASMPAQATDAKEKTRAKWYYYNESGEKIEVTGGQLKGLAKAGMITPDTIVETEEGKSAPARRVKGLTFPESAPSEAASPETIQPEPAPQPVAEEEKIAGEDSVETIKDNAQNTTGDVKDVSQGNGDDVERYREKAEQGDADAQYQLGKCYAGGIGVPKDEAVAMEWYRKAAEQGEAEAQLQLGDCYFKGVGVPEDREEAFMWYYKAAEQGHANATCALGSCYYHGWGVPQDLTEAKKWGNKAKELGSSRADALLAEIATIEEEKIAGEDMPDTVEVDLREFTDYATIKTAFSDMKEYLYEKRGDRFEAWKDAAESGCPAGQTLLGLCYAFDGDHGKAVEWYRKAAEQGYAEAQYRLAIYYIYGDAFRTSEVSSDLSEATKWYNKVKEQGHPKAEELLKSIKIKKDADAATIRLAEVGDRLRELASGIGN